MVEGETFKRERRDGEKKKKKRKTKQNDNHKDGVGILIDRKSWCGIVPSPAIDREGGGERQRNRRAGS